MFVYSLLIIYSLVSAGGGERQGFDTPGWSSLGTIPGPAVAPGHSQVPGSERMALGRFPRAEQQPVHGMAGE